MAYPCLTVVISGLRGAVVAVCRRRAGGDDGTGATDGGPSQYAVYPAVSR
jgi:hypothetical protein